MLTRATRPETAPASVFRQNAESSVRRLIFLGTGEKILDGTLATRLLAFVIGIRLDWNNLPTCSTNSRRRTRRQRNDDAISPRPFVPSIGSGDSNPRWQVVDSPPRSFSLSFIVTSDNNSPFLRCRPEVGDNVSLKLPSNRNFFRGTEANGLLSSLQVCTT